jgi:hypothetical protein
LADVAPNIAEWMIEDKASGGSGKIPTTLLNGHNDLSGRQAPTGIVTRSATV